MSRQSKLRLLGPLLFLMAVFSAPLHAVPVPVDLTSWIVDGAGSWSFPTTDTALQSANSIPTVLFNNLDSQGTALSGTIEVNSAGGDDDFIGFVLGYDDNDLFGANPSTDYILVDWKKNAQAGWAAGMAISRVTDGPIASSGTDTGGDAWTHTGDVSFIQSAATLGATGWAYNTQYLFEIIFNPSNIQVSVDGVQQFDINGTFENGSFGFYNFSQPRVTYAGITEEDSPPTCGVPGTPDCDVPVPGTITLFGISLFGYGWLRRRKA